MRCWELERGPRQRRQVFKTLQTQDTMNDAALFSWDLATAQPAGNRIYYRGFTLNGVSYSVGQTVTLFPETDDEPLHIGRIRSAFVDCSPDAQEPHSLEVGWCCTVQHDQHAIMLTSQAACM